MKIINIFDANGRFFYEVLEEYVIATVQSMVDVDKNHIINIQNGLNN